MWNEHSHKISYLINDGGDCRKAPATPGLPKTEESVTFSALGWGGGGVRWSEVTLLRCFFAAQKPFVCLKEAPKQTLRSLLTSDMLDIASNSVLKPAVALPIHQ